MSVELVKKYFENTELEGKVLEFPTSSATVELAADAVGTEPDRIAKTMAFLLGDEAIVIVVSGLSRIDNKKFKAQFHTKAKMIPYDRVEELTGHLPGGVCPFGVKDGSRIYLDESLKNHEVVYPAAGDDCSGVKLTIPELEDAVGEYSWIDVSK